MNICRPHRSGLPPEIGRAASARKTLSAIGHHGLGLRGEAGRLPSARLYLGHGASPWRSLAEAVVAAGYVPPDEKDDIERRGKTRFCISKARGVFAQEPFERAPRQEGFAPSGEHIGFAKSFKIGKQPRQLAILNRRALHIGHGKREACALQQRA